VEEFIRAYLTAALSFLALALLALPFLKKNSPSFIVDLLGIAMLLAFIVLLLIYGRKIIALHAP
jgi:uncharacterized membrane protein